MKGYISVNDNRSYYLKQIFLQNGYEICDYQSGLDFYFIDHDLDLQEKNVFSLNDDKAQYVINDDQNFRHFNNTLTVAGFLAAIKEKLYDQKILILGFGDLAKQLARVLKPHNDITIANRNYKEIEVIKKNYQHIDIHLMTGYYDYIINTVPAKNIDYDDLQYQKIFDLANSLKKERYESLRKLPARYFPYESAWLMFQYMEQVLRHD